MPIDRKYGKLSFDKPNGIREDEPVIVFRAQDKLLPKVLGFYLSKCLEAGSPREHIDKIHDCMDAVREWQVEHTTKVPD